jgi:hypothetical protein
LGKIWRKKKYWFFCIKQITWILFRVIKILTRRKTAFTIKIWAQYITATISKMTTHYRDNFLRIRVYITATFFFLKTIHYRDNLTY